EVQENDIVHDGTDRVVRRELVDAEQLGVLIIQEGRQQATLAVAHQGVQELAILLLVLQGGDVTGHPVDDQPLDLVFLDDPGDARDRKSTRLNSSHGSISYAVFCLENNNQTAIRVVDESVEVVSEIH